MTCFRQTPNWAQLLLVTTVLGATACGGVDPHELFAPSTPAIDSGLAPEAAAAVDAGSSADTTANMVVDAAADRSLDVTVHADVIGANGEAAPDAERDGARLVDGGAPDHGRTDAPSDSSADDVRSVQDAGAGRDADASPDGPSALDEADSPCVATDLCTTASRDPSGACVQRPVVCPAADECHVAGTCNPATGRCTAVRAPEGAVCATAQGGRCSAAALCTPTFVVARVGDGIADLLVGRAAAVRLERRYLAPAAALVPELGNPVALPIAAQGGNHPFTLSAYATGEGALSVSADGRFVTLAGYNATPGTASVWSTADRIVARVDRNNVVDTSTRLTVGLEGGNVRGAASLDGTQYWVSGGGDSPGIYFLTHGTSGGTPILAESLSIRAVNVVDSQLYATSLTALLAVGSGASGAMSQEATPLLTGGDGLPFGFALVDRDPTIAGVDTAYVAEGSEPDVGGGIQRWSKRANGGWRSDGIYSIRSEGGVRAVAAFVRDGIVTVVATTGAIEQNRIVAFDDRGDEQGEILTLRTASFGTGYRGVAFPP